jgi:hypothetical protein
MEAMRGMNSNVKRSIVVCALLSLVLATGCTEEQWNLCMGVGDPSWENVELISGDGSLNLDWGNLQNPVLGFESHRLKDQSVAYHDGYIYIFAGYSYRSPDLLNWEEITSVPAGDLVFTGDRWIVTHQVPYPDEPPGSDFRKIVWRQSFDLSSWSESQDMIQLEKDRNIDPAMAFLDETNVALVFKRGVVIQESQVAYGTFDGTGFDLQPPVKAYPGEGCSLDKKIPIIGDTITRWAENAQTIWIDDKWRIIATARHPDRPIDTGYVASHEPFIYEVEGNDFSQWIRKRHLIIPEESWNTVMHANTAFLLDLRDYDSWFYIFYSGADRLDPDLRGHGKIGVARSRDLVNWYVPGDMTGEP